MTVNGWLQIVVFLALVIVTVKPLGVFMTHLFSGERTFLSPVLGPIERGFYRVAGVDPAREQNWVLYAIAMLLFNAGGFALTYVILRTQHLLPWNPQGFDGLDHDLAFNTAVSFTTNTNWQAYGGENTMSYFSQMVGLAVHNFSSAATGIVLAVALIRGFARSSAQTIGNFWVDLTRCTLYVLLPISIIMAIVYVANGVPQTMGAYVDATTVEGGKQTIALGPVASQMAIKHLGTNGGGFFNANASHPFENPNGITNLLTLWSIFAIGGALTYVFGRMVGDTRQGWAIFAAMLILVVAGIAATYWAESAGNPNFVKAGLDTAANMEGKETRFGIANSALFAVVTTDASCGAVNAMHDSFTPLGSNSFYFFLCRRAALRCFFYVYFLLIQFVVAFENVLKCFVAWDRPRPRRWHTCFARGSPSPKKRSFGAASVARTYTSSRPGP